MSRFLRLGALFLLPSVLLGCNGDGNGDDDDPIAPNCEEPWCAEVEIDATMDCVNPLAESEYSMETSIQGLTKELSCYGDENADGGLDLVVGVSPADGQAGGDFSEVWFRLRNYEGAGTYPLHNLASDGNHEGLLIVGNVDGDTNSNQTVGTTSCRETACEAVVSEHSDELPNDPSSAHPFRARVEITCPAGTTLTDMLCDDDAVACTFVGEPTLKFDVLCMN